MTLAIGDLQGCAQPLQRLLAVAGRAPETLQEPVWFCGDLINRGPDSLGALRSVMQMGDGARTVLGNHDLHLLAVACGARKANKRGDTLSDILQAPDRDALIDWLRHQPLAIAQKLAGRGMHLMVHAGVLPEWDVATTLELADEVHKVLRGPGWQRFMHDMYGNEPVQWSRKLRGNARLRTIVNVLTRMRYLHPDGSLEFDSKLAPADTPRLRPWFDMPDRACADDTVVFGHWSTLGLVLRHNLVALDTGCVWGGCLSAVRLESRELFQVPCAKAANGGD